MKWPDGFIYARSYLAVLAAMLFCFSLVWGLDAVQPSAASSANSKPVASAGIPAPRYGNLEAPDQAAAAIAWKYFANNYQSATGLVNSVDNYPASTMWDTGSYLMAVIAARRLELISDAEFDNRISRALASLAKLPLFDGELPNKSYSTVTLEMVDYNNHATPRGIGWSAIDVGRLLVSFNIIAWRYPSHTSEVRSVLERWKFAHLVEDGQLMGSAISDNNATIYTQEGRLGYEQYSAKSFELLGLDVSAAMSYRDFLRYVNIYGVKVPTDLRNPEKYHAHNYVVSEPYILDGIEFGWDSYSHEFAYRVYRAQEKRFDRTRILTAVSEDNIDQAPYFVYNTVFTNGKSWSTITDKGEDASPFKSLSTKAVFGWYALYADPYTAQLREAIKDAYDADRGWYAGIYEKSGKPNRAITANTNAIILESLCYRKFGQLVKVH